MFFKDYYVLRELGYDFETDSLRKEQKMEENKKELFDIDTSVMYILGISEALFDFQLLVQIKRV